jgi:branched-chain amino acid transport system ATP-binding protein
VTGPVTSQPNGCVGRGGQFRLTSVTAGYGRATILRDVSISVPRGKVAALIGPNGAGKTTLLRVAAGMVRPTAGRVVLDGEDLTGEPPYRRARRGICSIPEGRGIFPDLSVRENLILQAPPGTRNGGPARAFEAFPVLGKRVRQAAGSLSGGEQQMLALARCFLTRPRVVLLDEVSLGLAPRIIDTVYEALQRLVAEGVSLLLVEQYVHRALAMADTVHLLGRGTLTYSGLPGNLTEDELARSYLGPKTRPGRSPARHTDKAPVRYPAFGRGHPAGQKGKHT